MKTKRSTFRPLALAAALAALQGCGGGGGGGGFAGPLPPTTTNTTRPGVVSTVVTPPAPREPTAEELARVEGAEEVSFTVRNPQEGSTAQVGTDWEGIYESSDGFITLIAPNTDPAGGDPLLFSRDETAWTFGLLKLDSPVTWTFDPEQVYRFTDDEVLESLTGHGSFGSQSSMFGSYAVNGGPQTTVWGPLKYSLSNALAVSPADLEGTWRSESGDVSITFASDGTFTGATTGDLFRVCTLAGAVNQGGAANAGRKNLFYLGMTAAIDPAASAEQRCDLDTSSIYGGLSAVLLTSAGPYHSNGYFRAFGLHAASLNGGLVSLFLSKVQP